ncbi:sodium/glutamate symporter [Vibrio chagasii]|nr:sodium/glutamate symporter [Vibrio chagasii]
MIFWVLCHCLYSSDGVNEPGNVVTSTLRSHSLVILSVQAVVLGLFSYFVTFKVMGSNYDAAVMSGGHCGFGLGVTPTAVMNMASSCEPIWSITTGVHGGANRWRILIDIVNLIILQGYISLIGCIEHLA